MVDKHPEAKGRAHVHVSHWPVIYKYLPCRGRDLSVIFHDEYHS